MAEPLELRGEGGSDNSKGDGTDSDVSRADSMDVSESEDYADIEAEYSADQATRDQERAEEDEEMAARASTFPADKETAYTRPTICFLCVCLSRISELETVLLKSLPFFNHLHHWKIEYRAVCNLVGTNGFVRKGENK